MFKRFPLADFAPDADPITQGIILDMDGCYPTAKGYKTLPSLIQGAPALPGPCVGSFIAKVQAGTVVVAGTASQLYMLVGGVWVAQGLTVTPFIGRWRFDSYGNDIIAVNGADPPFVSANGATFAALGGSPPISDLVQATDFSLWLNEADSFTWWSSLSDILWTPSIATETVSASIDATPGNMTGIKALRSGLAITKRDSLFYASFSNPPLFWEIKKVSEQIGSASQENLVVGGDALYFVGPDDFYRFDGYSLDRIPNMLREWFFSDFSVSYDYNLAGRYDEDRNLIFWHYPSVNASPAGTLDSWICLNIRTGKWAAGRDTIQMPLGGSLPASQAITYDDFGNMFATYDDIPNIPYNWSQFGTSGRTLTGFFGDDNILYLYGTDATTEAYLTTGDLGDRRNMFAARRIRPGFVINPGYGNTQVEVLSQYLQGTTPSLAQTVPMSRDGNYNILVTARLQRYRFRFYSEAEMTDFEAEFEAAGEV